MTSSPARDLLTGAKTTWFARLQRLCVEAVLLLVARGGTAMALVEALAIMGTEDNTAAEAAVAEMGAGAVVEAGGLRRTICVRGAWAAALLCDTLRREDTPFTR